MSTDEEILWAWNAPFRYEGQLGCVKRCVTFPANTPIKLDSGMPRYLTFTWTAEDPMSFKVADKKVKTGDHLYIIGEANRGVEVQVVGWNLEHEPICQRVDGEPFEWGGVRRHVLDMPAKCLSWERPLPTLRELAAEAVEARKDTYFVTFPGSDRRPMGRILRDMAEALEREAKP